MLRVANAAFRHPNGRGIEGLTFTVAPGEAVALIGPNGAGKSTLFAGLLGLLPLAQGSMTIGPDGTPPPGYIGYLPQHTTIEPDFPITLYQVVLLGRVRQFDYRLWPGRRDREAARAALRTTGLLPLRRERFGALSGGQRQRGLLARALVGAPRLLLLDEPFNGLDQTSRRELSATLNALKAEGVGLLIATHDFALARTACDTALLVNGRQLGHGPVTGVLTAEGLPAEFLHAHPHGTVPDGTLVPEPGTHPEAAGSPESATVLEPGTPIQDVLEPPRTVAAALPNPPE